MKLVNINAVQVLTQFAKWLIIFHQSLRLPPFRYFTVVVLHNRAIFAFPHRFLNKTDLYICTKTKYIGVYGSFK